MSLKKFHKVHGSGDRCDRPSGTVLKKYAGKLPDVLLEEWREYGWCSYARGVLWTVEPGAFKPVLKEWLPDWCKDGSNTFVFARTGFGDLFVYRKDRGKEETVGHLHVHYGRYMSFDAEIGMFFEYELADRTYLRRSLDGPLTEKAVKKLGPLAPDEMFTFEPALALGGESKLKYVNKVKMFPQLSFLAQLFDKITIE